MSDQARYEVHNKAGSRESVPSLVTVNVWGTSSITRSLARMGKDRGPVRSLPGCSFAKLLGTGSGRSFTMADADLHHWAVLACWESPDDAARGTQSASYLRWRDLATEEASFTLRPLSSRGSWAGRHPFGEPIPHRWDGPIAAVTRARIKTRQWRAFWGAVPPVSADLHAGEGLLFALGIGEAPVGLQGTFSIWSDNAALTDFAQRRSPHQEVVRKTHELGWYSEELFARFALMSATGRYDGRPVPTGKASETA